MELVSNDPWRLRLGANASVPEASSWPILASAKLAVMPVARAAASSIDSQSTHLLSHVAPPLATFVAGRVWVRTEQMTLEGVEWDMMRATMSATYGGDSGLVMRHEQRVLLSMPNVLLHTVTFSGPGSGSVALRQEVRFTQRDDGRDEVAFGGVLLSASNVALESTSSTSVAHTVFLPGIATTSLASLPQIVEPSLSGSGERRAFVDVTVDGEASNNRIHIATCFFGKASVSTAMAARNFARTMVSRSPAGVEELIERHEAQWAMRWSTFVDVPSASDRVRVALVTAAYNIHACSPGALDVAGSTYTIGLADDAVVPAQVLMVPQAAREWLGGREGGEDAEEAEEAAQLRGLEGRLYAYGVREHPQVCRAFSFDATAATAATTAAPTAASSSSVRMLGTMMSGINAWNYFRVSQDRAWLMETGYGLLEECANLVASIVNEEGHIVNATSLADSLEDVEVVDEALCVAASAAVMRAAFEASYLLGYRPPAAWATARYALALPMSGAVISKGLSGGGGVPPEVPLAVLCEPVGSLVESELAVNVAGSILANQEAWAEEAAEAADAGVTWGDDVTEASRELIQLHAVAKAMQVRASLSASFFGALESFLDAHCDFGTGFGSLVQTQSNMPNDLGMSARFLMVFLSGLAGATVCGGVGESGSVYASFGVNLGASAVLPDAWDRLLIRGLGSSKIDAILLNRSLYYSGGGGVGSGGSNNLVYWSTDSLIL